MKKIQASSVSFVVKFKGNGCVNFDSAEQAFYLRNIGILKGATHDNMSYAKKSFSFGNDGNEGFKYKVSSECLRHAMFKDEMGVQVNENVMQLPMVLYNAIATPAMIERGYMFAAKPSTTTKKTIVTITDAIEEGRNLRYDVHFDFHSKSVKKENTAKADAKNDDDVKGGTSIYSIENVGEITYTADGVIDMNEMQFISLDDTYDRRAVNVDVQSNKDIYMDAISRNIPNFGGKEGYYYIKNNYAHDEWAEHGILLSEDDVDFLTKDIIKRILNINIYRRNAILKCQSLSIMYFDENGVEVSVDINANNINDYKFVPVGNYNEANEELILANRKKYEELLEKQKQESKKGSKSKKNND